MLNKLQSFFLDSYQFIQRRNISILKIGMTACLMMMLLTSLLLIKEYFFFKTQSEKMFEIKEDYRNYVVAVKKILNDYHKNKERLDELETMLEEKKTTFKTVSS